jgi:hypothetical protein
MSRGARVPHLVGSRLSSPYHFRARIQSFQAFAAPFPGGPFAVSPSRRDPGGRNASPQKIDNRLAGVLGVTQHFEIQSVFFEAISWRLLFHFSSYVGYSRNRRLQTLSSKLSSKGRAGEA